MATLAPRLPALAAERRFFTASATGLLAVSIIGFIPTWLMAGTFGAPPLPGIVHLHGAVFLGWMLLVTLQTGLIAAGQPRLHRRIGTAGAVLALLVLVLGIVIALEGARRGAGGPERNQAAFLVNPLANILVFAGMVTAGFLWRRQAGHHERLMLLATMALAVTPLARIGGWLGMMPRPVGGMLLSDLFLAALVAHDLRGRGRLHPVTLWGGGLYLLSQPARVLLGASEPWQDFARGLIG